MTDARFPRHAALWRLVVPHLPATDLGHDAEHVRRVYRWALRLAAEAGADPDHAGAAALIHDLKAVPKDDPRRALAGEIAADAAAEPLAAAG